MLTRMAPLLFVLMWSTGFIGSKAGAPFAEPFTFLAIRFALVLLLLVPLCLVAGTRWPQGRAFMFALVIGMLIHGAYLGGVFWAIRHDMPAGVSAVIVSMQPVATALLAWPLLGERISKWHWLALGLGLVGVLAILLPKAGIEAGGITVATVAACVIALIGITVGTVLQKLTMSDIDLRGAAAVQYLGALLLTAAWSFAFESQDVIWSGRFIAAMTWLVIVLSIGAIGLLLLMIREKAVSRVATLFYLVPAVTSVIAWFLFNEKLQPIQLLGIILVTLAVMLVSRAGDKKQ